jgi:hypothetical protein
MCFGKSYTAEQVKSPDQQRMSIEKFKEAFSKKANEFLAGPLPKEQKKEELHAAHSSSFVLKI